MDVVKGMIVKSLAGRDKGELRVVVDLQGNNALLCDGKKRKLENPKIKNIKHLEKTKTVIDANLLVSDADIKKEIKEYINGKISQTQEVSPCQKKL